MLRGRGLSPRVVLYLDAPLGADEVRALAAKLGAPASTLLRSKEPEYAQLGLSSDSSIDVVARAIADHPVLLERPILVVGDRAAIGRPLENFERLLSGADGEGDDAARSATDP